MVFSVRVWFYLSMGGNLSDTNIPHINMSYMTELSAVNTAKPPPKCIYIYIVRQKPSAFVQWTKWLAETTVTYIIFVEVHRQTIYLSPECLFNLSMYIYCSADITKSSEDIEGAMKWRQTANAAQGWANRKATQLTKIILLRAQVIFNRYTHVIWNKCILLCDCMTTWS